jgi:hypothetical protein
MMKDTDGILLANFNRASITMTDPFIFPSQVQQALFLCLRKARIESGLSQ